MILQINNQYRITCDNMNFTIERLATSKDKTKEPQWYVDGYFRDLDQCYKALLDPKRCIADSEAKCIVDLKNYIRGLHDEFIAVVTAKTTSSSSKDCEKVVLYYKPSDDDMGVPKQDCFIGQEEFD